MSPAQTDPIPSLSPRGAPENLPAGEEAGRGKRVCPGGERTPPLPRPRRCVAGLPRGRRERTGSHKHQKRWYRPRHPPSLSPFRRTCSKLNPGSSHGQKRTRTALPPTLRTAPSPLPAAGHLLVPSAPVRPSICLHTFGGNLWASLRSQPNPSRPDSLSA